MNYVWAGLLGSVFGSAIFWWGLHTGRKVRVPQSNACSCQHAFGYHRNKKDCNQLVKVHGYVKKCPCQHYDGPLPAEEYLKNANF